MGEYTKVMPSLHTTVKQYRTKNVNTKPSEKREVFLQRINSSQETLFSKLSTTNLHTKAMHKSKHSRTKNLHSVVLKTKHSLSPDEHSSSSKMNL